MKKARKKKLKRGLRKGFLYLLRFLFNKVVESRKKRGKTID